MDRTPVSSASGFSLLEVLVASGLLVTALVALAQLFAIATSSNLSARNTTLAALLAEHKVEELRALTWGFDSLGMPVGDFSSDTTVAPERPAGGTGLSPSPGGALQVNTPGYVDYIDGFGAKVAGGAQPPGRANYIRRWSIDTLTTDPHTLIIQVLVTPKRNSDAGRKGVVRRLPEEARIVTLKTRKGP